MSSEWHSDAKQYGVLGSFTTPEDLLAATQKASDAGYRKMEAYSPIPIDGLTEALKYDDSRLGWITFGGGLTGLLTGIGLEIWSSTQAYAHNVGGKPLISWPMFFPVMYECTILFAAFGATFGMIALCGLPKPHQPIFNAESFARASQDRFVLCIEADDAIFDMKTTTEFLKSLGAEDVEEVMTSEGY